MALAARRCRMQICFLASAVYVATAAAAPPPSVCFGTSSHGRLQDGVQLPPAGKNVVAYSDLGRNWVHASVAGVMLAAWQQLEAAAPGVTYVYGETGRPGGGLMPPHRTHEAGISVDFMVPVRDAAGQSVRLPASASNKYGYAWEFDAAGKAGGLTIDYEALGEHLFQLDRAARLRKVPIARIIFDPRLMPALFRTRHGVALQAMPFMRQQPWIRHDEHYHVDFGVPCRPFNG